MSPRALVADHERADRRQRNPLVDFVKRCLSREERIIVTLHYCEELTLHEISVVLDRPFEHVHRLHQRVLDRVQRQFRPAAGGRITLS